MIASLSARARTYPYTTRLIMLIAIMAVGVFVRFWNLGGPSLSYDESFTVMVARQSPVNLLAATAGDVHPPLWYILEWAILRVFGSEAWAVRLPSVLFGIMGLGLAMLFAFRLDMDIDAVHVGVAIMALAPFQVHYSQDARMYTLLQAEVLLALIAVWDRNWRVLALALTLMFYTHNYGVIYWIVIGAIAFVREMQLPVVRDGPGPVADPNRMLMALIIPGVLFLPWAAVVFLQVQGLSTTGYWIQPLTLPGFIGTFYVLIWHYSLHDPLAEFAAIVTFGLLFVAIIHAARAKYKPAMQLCLILIAPMLLAAVISAWWRPMFLYRALIGVTPMLYLLMGWVIWKGSWVFKAWSAAILVPLAVIGLITRANQQMLVGSSEIAQEYIATHAQPGDIVYHGNVGSWLGFQISGPDLPQYLMPEVYGSVGTLTAQTREALGAVEIPLTALPWRRAWLVWGAVPTITTGEDQAIEALLAIYPHQQVIDLDAVFTGDDETVDGGVWLLER